MERYSDAVINENGRAIAGASVRILDANGLLASIYSDLAGTAMPNPTATDTLGRWSFCAPAGMYSAEIILGNVVRYTLKDIALIDPSSDLSVLASNTGAGLIGTSSGQTVQQVTNTNASQIAANAAAITTQANNLAASGGAALIGVSTGGNLQTKLNGLTTSVAGLSNYTLPVATSSVLGGVKQGAGVSIDGAGVLSVSYAAPIATATTVGVVKPGSGLVIDGAGVLTATGTTTGSVASVNTITPTSGNVTLTTDNIAESGSPTNKWFTPARVIASVLTGLSTATNAAVTAADTILAALGKLQAQISANTTVIASKDVSGGYAGLTGFAINLKNAAGSILSKIVSTATAARTWTFPDKDITVAGTTNETFTKPTFIGYREGFQAVSAGSSGITLNPDAGSLIEVTVTANTTIMLPAAASGLCYSIIVIYSGGAWSITFAGGTAINWSGGSTPTTTSINGKKDKYVFTCGGSYTLGQDGGRNF